MTDPLTMNRRDFLKGSGAVCLLGGMGSLPWSCHEAGSRKITIAKTFSAVEREPLVRPFGFKGGYLTELWQSVAGLESTSGERATGLGTQSVLWSDVALFEAHTEEKGNSLMYAITQRSLEILKGTQFSDPVTLLEELAAEVAGYAAKITGRKNLRKTFILNALVPVDNAVWLLMAKICGITSFDRMIPPQYRPVLSDRHGKIAAIPLISYDTPPSQVKQAVEEGYFFMKIKIGQPGTQEQMLRKDMERLSELHRVMKDLRTPYTSDGKLPYYFDANGRYQEKETFLKFLAHAENIGALEQIAMVEEPFPEELETDVSSIPVRLTADETAHTDTDTLKRIDMGYRAVALKPIAKTLSMSLKIARAASERNVPCFCADLTVNPVLVEWNKNMAARLSAFPGIGNLGLVESNGHQNYRNWEKMKQYLPDPGVPWIEVEKGVYQTNADYFREGGGIFRESLHYETLLKR